jgi:hypothetical protein
LTGIVIVLVEVQPLELVTVVVIVTDPVEPALNLMDFDPAPDVIVPLEMDQL